MRRIHSLRLLVFLILTVLVFFTTYGQHQWNKTYVEDRPLMLFSSVVNIDSNYIVIGSTVDSQNTIYGRPVTCSINNEGTMTKYNVKGDSTVQNFGVFANSLINTGNNNFVFSGYVVDSLPRIVFARFNASLESIHIHTYSTPNTYAFFGNALLQYDANSYYITGVRTLLSSNDANIVLLKIDSNGNRLSEKYYNSYIQDYAKSICGLHNGNLLIGGVRRNLNQTNEKSNTWLLEVDTAGAIIRQWLDPNDSTYVAEGLTQTRDGGFIYAAQKKSEQTINSVFCIGTVIKMDSAFNKQWAFTGGNSGMYTGFYDVEELPDGSVIACGKFNYYNAWIVKLSAQGQLLWERKYAGFTLNGSQNYLTDIDVLPDGSLIAVGQCQQSAEPRQVGWFLKLDSNGCEMENCLVGIEKDDRQQTIDDRQIQIQPNPANGSVQVTVEQDMLGGIINLHSVTGALVMQQTAEAEKTQLNLTAISTGMYIVTVQKQGQIARGRLVVE